MRNCMEELEKLFQAKVECIWINTYEEEQVVEDIKEIANRMATLNNVYLWSHMEGSKRLPLTEDEEAEAPDPKMASPGNLFVNGIGAAQRSESNRNIWILRDVHLMSDRTEYKRALRDLKEYASQSYNPIVVIAPYPSIPTEHEKLFRVMEYDLPSTEMISDIVDKHIDHIASSNKKKEEEGKELTHELPKDGEREHIIRSLHGLTYNEIRATLRESLVKKKKLDLDIVKAQKIQLVKKSGVLDVVDSVWSIEDMGGNHAFKEWLKENAIAMTEEAADFSDMDFRPKGYLAVGIPGASE